MTRARIVALINRAREGLSEILDELTTDQEVALWEADTKLEEAAAAIADGAEDDDEHDDD